MRSSISAFFNAAPNAGMFTPAVDDEVIGAGETAAGDATRSQKTLDRTVHCELLAWL